MSRKITIIIEDDFVQPGTGYFPKPWDTTTTISPYYPPITNIWDRPCLIQEFFRNNPGASSCMISCTCPRCTPQCLFG